jgi:hypothetical protein
VAVDNPERRAEGAVRGDRSPANSLRSARHPQASPRTRSLRQLISIGGLTEFGPLANISQICRIGWAGPAAGCSTTTGHAGVRSTMR